MAEIDHLADNKADGTTYAHMRPADRRIWLRTWLRKHHSYFTLAELSYAAAMFALLA
jgi:hypothetical protein